jgi:hypothetical protein
MCGEFAATHFRWCEIGRGISGEDAFVLIAKEIVEH